MPYILALDQGTTSSRAIVFDHDGAIRARRAEGIRPDLSAAGLGRARPGRDLGLADRRRRRSARARASVAAEATSRRSASPTSARRPSSGIARPGEPIYNAIVWQDRRTADFCDELKAQGAGETIQAQDRPASSTPISPASKIRWILDNVPGARARADAGELAFGTVDSWLVWKLTGGAPSRHRRRATRRGRCCSTSTRGSGTTSC